MRWAFPLNKWGRMSTFHTFFLLQALHGIKPSRVTSKVAVSQLLKTRKQKQSKHPNHHASDTNPPSQDWRPSRKRVTNRAIDESAGRQASPNKKPIKTIHLYKSTRILARYQDGAKKKTIAPGGQKHAEIGRSKTTDIIRRR